jgi:hypothetical protein
MGWGLEKRVFEGNLAGTVTVMSYCTLMHVPPADIVQADA